MEIQLCANLLSIIIDNKLILVVIRGFGKLPMMLITNINPTDKRLSLTILKVYLKRWWIEEYFRFKKQQFNFEDIRVRSKSSIKTKNLILSLTIGFIAMFSEKIKLIGTMHFTSF